MEPEKNEIVAKFVPTRFTLPLFMVSRNRIKLSKLDQLRSYIKENTVLYNKDVNRDFEKATLQHFQHVVGIDASSSMPKQHEASKIGKRSPEKIEKQWQLPPNLYEVCKPPFETKKGAGGAHWNKTPTNSSKIRKVQQLNDDFCNLPEMSEKLFAPCNRSKGIFLSNPRERNPTSRGMVTSITSCYRDPSEPGPATYDPTYLKEMPEKRLETFNIYSDPNKFYSASVVPVKANSIHYPNTSFTGAPGRYDIRYPKLCPCSSKREYYPEKEVAIDREKRKKFRRLPYEVINSRYYTSPDWRHVKGQGFRHLFMGSKPIRSKALPEKESKRQQNFKLYLDSKYIGMIINPTRTTLSFRSHPIKSLPPSIKFNCTPKIISRRQLKSNKKIAFNSTRERFKDGYRLPILTVSQQEEIKQTLPLDRQFRDHPIMNRRPSEINSKLDAIPQHMLPDYVPALRKKLFKFQPLPEAKVLVAESDTDANKDSKDGFYLRSMEAKNFFK